MFRLAFRAVKFAITFAEKLYFFILMSLTKIFRILDTKYMASIAPLKELISNTGLGEMEKILSKGTFPKINIGKYMFLIKRSFLF